MAVHDIETCWWSLPKSSKGYALKKDTPRKDTRSYFVAAVIIIFVVWFSRVHAWRFNNLLEPILLCKQALRDWRLALFIMESLTDGQLGFILQLYSVLLGLMGMWQHFLVREYLAWLCAWLIIDTYGIANAISGLVIVASTILPVCYVDRWRRRNGMIAGALLCAVWMAVLSAISAVYGSRFSGLQDFYDDISGQSTTLFLREPRASSIAFFVVFYIFLATYGCLWGPLAWIFSAELFPNGKWITVSLLPYSSWLLNIGVRSKGLSIATATNWFFTFGVVELSPIAFNSIQWVVFVIYCVFCICIAIIVYLYFPETKVTARRMKCDGMSHRFISKGMSLEEIDLLFSANFKSYDPNLPHPRAASETLEQIDQRYIKGRRVLQFGHDYPRTLSPEPPTTLPENIIRNPSPIL